MNNLSLFGEIVKFTASSKKILVFDILYIEQMRDKKHLFQNDDYSIIKIESEIFKWSDGSLLGLYFISNECNNALEIDVNQIKYFSDVDNLSNEKVFGTDSGVICMIDFSVVPKFLDMFVYDDFVDLLNQGVMYVTKYINEIDQSIGDSFAIISTPGIGKGYEFVGSGSYYIESNCFE